MLSVNDIYVSTSVRDIVRINILIVIPASEPSPKHFIFHWLEKLLSQ